MRWNPCGRIVDFGSRPFRATYRPFRDSDQEVEVEWFPAAPGALPLGRLSNITIPYWEQDQFEYDDGDLPLSSAEPTGKPVVRPGTGRGHVCGTDEDFREGGSYEPEGEPVTYGQQGLPTCCGAPVVAGGAVSDSGQVVVLVPIVPGQACEDATEIPLGEWLEVFVPAGNNYWLRFPSFTPVSETRLFTAESAAGTNTATVKGGNCAFLFDNGVMDIPGSRVLIVGPLGENWFFLNEAPVAADLHFRIRADVV